MISCRSRGNSDCVHAHARRRFMDSGLFALCRHPNYFGEILLWTSLTVLAGTNGVFVKHPWIVVSPLFTAFLLLYASGRSPITRAAMCGCTRITHISLPLVYESRTTSILLAQVKLTSEL